MPSPSSLDAGGAVVVRTATASSAIVRALMSPPRPARVLGSSPAALYLAVDGDDPIPDVIAVVATWALRLPLAMVVSIRAPAVDAAEPVLVGGGGVDVGGLRLRPVRWTDPRPHLPGPVVPERLAAAEEMLALLPADAAGLRPARAMEIATALAHGDAGVAAEVIGLGPGLTPAGDDVVAGVLAALALQGGVDARTADTVLALAATATTVLSAALLRCAAHGQVLPQAAGLLGALCGAGATAPALRALVAVGGTSGAALAHGLCAGARAALISLTEDQR